MERLTTLILKEHYSVDDIYLKYGEELSILILLLIFAIWIWRNTRNEFRLYVLHKGILNNCFRNNFKTPRGSLDVLFCLKKIIIPGFFLIVLLFTGVSFTKIITDTYTYYKTDFTELLVISEKPIIVKTINKSIEQTFCLEEDSYSISSKGEKFKIKISEPNKYNRVVQITLPHWSETLQFTIALITLIFMIKTMKNVFSAWAEPYFQEKISNTKYDLIIEEKKEKLWIIILIIVPIIFVACNSL